MYGSHSGQQGSAPPQPEWRLQSTTQRPPPQPSQPSQPSWRASSPPPPPRPPRPTSSPYDPNAYGQISSPSPAVDVGTSVSPVPGIADADTTPWGVKYNRHQLYAQSPPPLPPRPSSTAQSPQPQSPIVSPLDSTQPLPAGPGLATQPAIDPYQQWSTTPFASQQPANNLPSQPPPPHPIPTGYQSSNSQQSNPWQQQQQPPPQGQLPPPPYSGVSLGQYHSSSVQQLATLPVNPQLAGHNAPGSGISQTPSPQQTTFSPYQEQFPVAATVSTEYGVQPTAAPPVPPKTSPITAPTSASILGSGGPSDWEHLSPIPGSIDDSGAFGPRRQASPSLNSALGVCSSQPTTLAGPIRHDTSISPTTPTGHLSHVDERGQREGSLGSPSKVQDYQNPPRPTRMESAGSVPGHVSMSEPSESIDGIIEAWTKPISSPPSFEQHPQSLESRAGTSERPSPVETHKPKQDFALPRKQVRSASASAESDAATNEVNTEKRTILPTFVSLDPYDDLDPWSKSSLERYVAMLRKEAVADSDAERFSLFMAFIAKETKLREILFNVEAISTPVDDDAGGGSRQPTPSLQESTDKGDDDIPPVESGLIPVETDDDYFISANNHDDSEDGSYSPGGRPILPIAQTPSATSLKRSASRSTSEPPSMLNDSGREHTLPPLTTNPPQPIYTPFRYTEGPQRGSDELVFDQPAYQAYSALRQASAESGRVMSNAPASTSPERSGSVVPSSQNERDETFIGLIREKSVAYRKRAPRKTPSPPPLPASLRHGKPAGPIEVLRSKVLSPLAKQSESSWNMTTRKNLESFSCDFGYIKEAVKTWEISSKPRREKVDKERIQRQEQSEKRIDALFNGKEIGYADINVLEEEFRQKEARAQLEEERQELDEFVANVFEPLDRRLKEEVTALQTHYESALAQLNHENSRIKDPITDKYNLSPTMKTVNEIHRKLERRFQKRLEIALDRERRRKKAERRPLVFMGDSLALKRVDKEFDQMEKRNILEAARERDERANRLMDSFDDAIMHGLGENQSRLDEVATKVTRVDVATIRSSALPESEVEQLLKSVYELVESLRQDSEAILHNFGIADSILNDADYSVSVAEARYSEADADVFRRLGDEKRKEDDKIQASLKSKLESVKAGPAKIITSINDLLKSLGKAPIIEQQANQQSLTDALAPASHLPTATLAQRKPEEDPEHQERLRRALENAKKRNAARKNTESSCS
ncbi:hypothetical protein BO94DRAFT_523013 [Aspergillus sclerotioniger CBS 115572]|uniref:Uncharacterized protein n=1 Tax=Aspergillus sclerotioniger CBS 115572 TaxID=1450535 RepID=A0A317VW58_9EURO|nr:hypothetical protein BO94DRAFT_523013 [Aspergillus sclerotioniger CBS 115572]PWY77222.1 hypothetical protein BO94DRAFT_523013 [Aspergillus sclerotioniger CBS 115572]